MAIETLGTDAQYRAIREEAGLLDRSSRARLVVSGSEAAEFLQGQLTNDVEALEPGSGCYAALLDRKGKIRADMRVLRLEGDRFLIDTEPEALDLLDRHLQMYKVGRDASVEPGPEGESLLSLLGPRSAQLAGDVPAGPEHSHREVHIAGSPCRAIATDGGIDLLVPPGKSEVVSRHLIDAGAAPIGEEAAEIARVEAGRPRLGRELGEGTMPQEAGINDRAVSFSKGCYIGQETVARLHYKGKPNRHLRGLLLSEPAERRAEIVLGDKPVGRIGSACVSPRIGPIALALVRREAAPGDTVLVDGAEARVAELPFERG
jgi:tRNA-modifying protein YgfZ